MGRLEELLSGQSYLTADVVDPDGLNDAVMRALHLIAESVRAVAPSAALTEKASGKQTAAIEDARRALMLGILHDKASAALHEAHPLTSAVLMSATAHILGRTLSLLPAEAIPSSLAEILRGALQTSVALRIANELRS